MPRQLTQLDNKIRVVSQKFKDRNSAAIGIMIGAGGRLENDADKGVAHYLEHMAFKGSKKYSCDAIKQEIEGVGGNLNAFTAEEETCYYAKIPSKYLSRTFDVLSDIAFFPTLNIKDFNKERSVILEEIKMYKDLPQYHVAELLQGMLWPNHSLGQSLAGSAETVGEMKINDLISFHGRNYIPGKIVIAACGGGVEHDEFVAMVRKKLSKLQSQDPLPLIKARVDQSKAAVHILSKDTEQMHVALGYLALPQNHPDYYILSLLSIILGGNMSSRLFNEVREKRGLAYSISCGIKSLSDTGCFVVRAGVDNSKLVDAITVIEKELSRMAHESVSVDEFKRARDYYIGQFQLGLEDTMDHMLWSALVLLGNDRAKTVKDVISRIEAVTIKDIKRVAGDILALNRANLSIIGPVTKPQQDKLHKLLHINN